MTKRMLLAAGLLALPLVGGCDGPHQEKQATPAATTPAEADRPWLDAKLQASQRVDLVLAAMTQEEKLRLVFGYFASRQSDRPDFVRPPESREGSAGYIPGIPRLGIPALWETDAGVGVATQGNAETFRERTALPSGMATAATWDPAIAYAGGAMIGDEARRSGFNVLLAGGVNLVREPRNGRNFEYGGEDPLLAGVMVGEQIRGIQSQRIISTIKHFAYNDQESGRHILNVELDEAAARMSDLLAFEFAIERSNPGSVMCAYNRVGGTYACENDWLLNDVLKRDWSYPGFVMSDWGAVHSTDKAANAGLDQQSAYTFDKQPFFGKPLADAVAAGRVPQARLDDMARRILTAMFTHGVVDHPVAEQAETIDFAAHAQVTRTDAERGAVLLRNQGMLPLAATTKRIVVIGGHADKGVLSGGGSSQVYPVGGRAVQGLEPATWPGPVIYFPSSPLEELRKLMPEADIRFVDGTDPDAAAKAARESDVAIIFATQWTSESQDFELTLPDGQDGLIAKVANANPRTAVVLQTGGPVLMPWLDTVDAVLEAWYPGTAGGEAIARLLTGAANPSGRLPVTFPASLDQLPRPTLDKPQKVDGKEQLFDVRYQEGAAVGYRWFEAKGLKPLFPFGHGLSYTDFTFGDLAATATGSSLTVRVTVRNEGARSGISVPQLYIGPVAGGWEAPRRLGGWQTVQLEPGASATVDIAVDPRLLATYDTQAREWRIAAGDYRVQIAASSGVEPAQEQVVTLTGATLPVTYDAPAQVPPATGR